MLTEAIVGISLAVCMFAYIGWLRMLTKESEFDLVVTEDYWNVTYRDPCDYADEVVRR